MLKSARWRSDKSKIKALFKLQFHATQLAETGGDGLTIAVIPGDVGKPTARLERTKVKDGICYWEKPHFENVKFTRDQKSGKIDEKIYRFVVATSSSSFGVVGEVSLDFAKYSEAIKLSSVSLPFNNAKSTCILHVSIQRVQDQREVNGSENVNEDDKGSRTHFCKGDTEESLRIDSIEDHSVLTDAISRVHVASSGSDITLSGSDSSSGLDTPRQPKVHELSTDESSDDVIKKLKGEIVILARQAEVSEMEIQTLRKQIVKESKRAQDCLKECESLKVKVKVNSNVLTEAELRQELNYEKDLNSNLRLQLQKTQESNAELILAVRDLDELLESKSKLQEVNYKVNTKDEMPESKMQKVNAQVNTEDEMLESMLKKGNAKGNSKVNTEDKMFESKLQEANSKVNDLDDMLESKSKLQEVNYKVNAEDEDQKALEDIVKEHSGIKDEQKITDLYNEIELYKRDKDELEIQLEHLALDYEILKQENHDICYKLQQSELQEQLKMQYECSTSYAELETEIKELETRVKNLEEDLENQAERFEADMEKLICGKVDCEKRAIQAELTLKKVKHQNAATAGRLQEELRKLSVQMATAFRENETEVMKAEQLRVDKRRLEETVKKVKQEFDYLGNQYENKLVNLSNQVTLKSKELEEMEKEVENLRHELTQQKISYNAKIENLDGEVNDRETEIRLMKMEMESLERLKTRCNEMKQFCKENELEKEDLRKQVAQLKGDLKKKDNKNVVVTRSPKEVTNMKDKIKLLEGQIKLKEVALERRLEAPDQNIENPQVSTTQYPNPATRSDHAIEPAVKKTRDEEIFEFLYKNKCMEVELKEMQERYSKISLKFAEVEGERQQLVMTLRNLKNSKLMGNV